MSITLVGVVRGAKGEIRHYQYANLRRPLAVMTLWGDLGSADVIHLTDLRWALYAQREHAAGRKPYADLFALLGPDPPVKQKRPRRSRAKKPAKPTHAPIPRCDFDYLPMPPAA
jgi:hypothetical protein